MALASASLVKNSLVDYPGEIAAVVFFSGCNLRCPWCHNGDLVLGRAQDLKPWAEIQTYLEARREVLGAVVFSGGEALLQPELNQAVDFVKSLGLKVKLDTNGTLPQALEALKGQLDFVALDWKASEADFETLTGRPGTDFSLARTLELLYEYWPQAFEIRTTWIPGLHTWDQIPRMAQGLRPGTPLTHQAFRPGPTLDPGFSPSATSTDLTLVAREFQRQGIHAHVR